MPIISTTRSSARLIAPASTRNAPYPSTTAAPTASPTSVIPRPRELIASTHIVVRKTSSALAARRRPRVPLCPKALRVAIPLEGVEELGREPRVRALAAAAARSIPPGERGRGDEGEKGEREEDEGDRKVEEREKREHDDRSECRHAKLGQELTEPRLELLDPLHDRDEHLPGSLQTEPRGPELGHLVVEALAKVRLHPGRGAMRDHVAPVLEPPPNQHDGADEGELSGQRLERLSREDPRDQPAEAAYRAIPTTAAASPTTTANTIRPRTRR